jgi:hypothetical protein
VARFKWRGMWVMDGWMFDKEVNYNSNL